MSTNWRSQIGARFDNFGLVGLTIDVYKLELNLLVGLTIDVYKLELNWFDNRCLQIGAQFTHRFDNRSKLELNLLKVGLNW